MLISKHPSSDKQMNIKENMSRIMLKEAKAIQNIVVTDDFEASVDLAMTCPGKVIRDDRC